MRIAGPLASAAAAGAVLALAGCGAGPQAHPHARAHATGASSVSPRQAVMLAAAHARQLRSVTATFTRQGRGALRQTLAGTVTEQLRPVLRASLAIPVMTTYGRGVKGGETMILGAGGLVYYRQPSLDAILGTRPWLKVRAADLSKPLWGSPVQDAIDLAEDNGPVIQAELLAAARQVRKAGTTRLDGNTVTEYTGRYQLPSAAAALPAGDAAAVRLEQVRAGYGPVTFAVWLDPGQQVRKLVVTEKLLVTANQLGQKAAAETQTMTIMVTSLNQPVTIATPPASQVSVVPRHDFGPA
jgi:hypothetical protein